MKTKIFLLASIIIFAETHTAFAQVATTTPTAATSSPSSIQSLVLGAQIPELILQITQAKAQLANVTLQHTLAPIYKNVTNKKTKKVTKTLTGYSLVKKDVALAILDPVTKNILITKGDQNGKAMDFGGSALDVKLVRFNGVNSQFAVNRPAGGVVLALKYLISGPETGSKASIENALNEDVYVPYSAGLDSPEVVAYGENYLNTLIQKVAADLKGLPSNAIPGQTITEAIKPALIKALVYAEHTDTTQVLLGNVQGTIHQLNILFAVNQGDTYKYSGSTAGALGIAQFIPSTYGALVKRHREANLISDFPAGMRNHENAIKAMYLLVDDYTGDVRAKAGDYYTPGMAFDYGAASYNGGVTRVAKAAVQFGSSWNQDHSGEVSVLQNQVNALNAQVNSLKSKIKTTKDKKVKADLQSGLSQLSSQLTNTTKQLTSMQSASLRQETVNYLRKIYSVIQVFNDQEI